MSKIKDEIVQSDFLAPAVIASRKIWAVARNAKILGKLYAKYYAKSLLGRYRKGKTVQYPHTIQLPITYKCNFNCVMCGMQELVHKKGFSPEELRGILQDKLYSKVIGVGVNGGEPFLLSNIEDYIQVLLDTLPQIRHIYIISNGYFTEKIAEKSKIICKMCHEHKVRLHLSISIDGVGEMQNIMRGNARAYEHSFATCQKILADKEKYCDDFGAICTITKINVYNLAELEVWAAKNRIPMSYNIATIHKRICNDEKYRDFSVYTDPKAQQMAAEFFYSKFLENYSEMYFARYYVVKYGKRIAQCAHKNTVVTLTPDGELSYCATHSNGIGNAFKHSSYNIYFSPQNIAYRESLCNEHCSSCTHYSDSLEPGAYKNLYIPEVKKILNAYV